MGCERLPTDGIGDVHRTVSIQIAGFDLGGMQCNVTPSHCITRTLGQAFTTGTCARIVNVYRLCARSSTCPFVPVDLPFDGGRSVGILPARSLCCP